MANFSNYLKTHKKAVTLVSVGTLLAAATTTALCVTLINKKPNTPIVTPPDNPTPIVTVEQMRSPLSTNSTILNRFSTDGTYLDLTSQSYRYNPCMQLSGKKGDDVFAALTGTVTEASDDYAWGKVVKLSHADGSTTRYLSMNSMKVKVGDKVEQGQVIGTVGSCMQEAALNDHLRFEYSVNGKAVDPASKIDAFGGK